MRMRVLLEPHHGASYDQILALARATEAAGFDAFFRSDHYLGIDPDDTGYRPTDSWTTPTRRASRPGQLATPPAVGRRAWPPRSPPPAGRPRDSGRPWC